MNSILPYTALFITTLTLRTLSALSASHWLILWISLELNLLSFIPIITSSSNHQESESAIKYFLAQAIGSGIILLSAIIKSYLTQPIIEYFPPLILIFGLIIKLGIAPCHFWFPNVMSGLNWLKCLILITWQKLIPLLILFSITSLINPSLFIFIASMGALIGGFGGINQTHLRPLLAYSSIGHIGWITAAAISSFSISINYLVTYIFISSNITWILHIWKLEQTPQSKNLSQSSRIQLILLSILLLSLGGLPPLLGFFPKWLTLETLINTNIFFIIFPLIIGSLINLFYYLTIFFSITLKSSTKIIFYFNKNTKDFLPLIASITLSTTPMLFIII